MVDCNTVLSLRADPNCFIKLKRMIIGNIVLYSILFCYILALTLISVFKYKVQGFPLRLLMLINLVPIGLVIENALELRIFEVKD